MICTVTVVALPGVVDRFVHLVTHQDTDPQVLRSCALAFGLRDRGKLYREISARQTERPTDAAPRWKVEISPRAQAALDDLAAYWETPGTAPHLTASYALAVGLEDPGLQDFIQANGPTRKTSLDLAISYLPRWEAIGL